jgi:hypothetical protein
MADLKILLQTTRKRLEKRHFANSKSVDEVKNMWTKIPFRTVVKWVQKSFELKTSLQPVGKRRICEGVRHYFADPCCRREEQYTVQ